MTSIYLIKKDRDILDGVQLSLSYRNTDNDKNAGDVYFQFPPVVVSDARRVNWNTENLPGKDPIAIYSSNSAREMSLKIEYIVEDESVENIGDVWSIGRIKQQINLLKGYFSGVKAESTGSFVASGTMTAYFRHTRITGVEGWSVRIGNVSVSYEGPHIGDGQDSHPLKTIINLDLATVSAGMSGSGKDTPKAVADSKVYWDGIKPFPTFEQLWY